MKAPVRNPNITVQLLDKEYVIACPQDTEAELLAAAEYLNKKMTEIKTAGKTIGLESIAIMAALNLSYELQQARENSDQQVTQRLQQLGDKIEHALRPAQPRSHSRPELAETE
ncbi:MAG: cell division protein ZapA [Amphritea sp.]